MSLRDAMLELVEQMEADAVEMREAGGFDSVYLIIKNYVRSIRLAVSASNESVRDNGQVMWATPPNAVLRGLVKQAQREKEDAERRVKAEEGTGACMGMFHGGPYDQTYVETPPGMPIGAKTAISGSVYQLQADGLHYSEEETVKYRESVAG